VSAVQLNELINENEREVQEDENLVGLLRERNTVILHLFEEKNSSNKARGAIFSSCLSDCLMQNNATMP